MQGTDPGEKSVQAAPKRVGYGISLPASPSTSVAFCGRTKADASDGCSYSVVEQHISRNSVGLENEWKLPTLIRGFTLCTKTSPCLDTPTAAHIELQELWPCASSPFVGCKTSSACSSEMRSLRLAVPHDCNVASALFGLRWG